jgi:hypothetical protein
MISPLHDAITRVAPKTKKTTSPAVDPAALGRILAVLTPDRTHLHVLRVGLTRQ